MTSENPWRKLAERLGVPGYQITMQQTWSMPPVNAEEFHQDLLVGRALRVAVDTSGDNIRSMSPEILDIVEFKGDARATAALELLDAVGYDHA